MQTYVAKTTINFEGAKFYVRVGDMLSHDPKNNNSLAVYRQGQIVKVMKVPTLTIKACLKSKFIEEVLPPSETETPIPVAPIPEDKEDSEEKERKRHKRGRPKKEKDDTEKAEVDELFRPAAPEPSQVEGPPDPPEEPLIMTATMEGV